MFFWLGGRGNDFKEMNVQWLGSEKKYGWYSGDRFNRAFSVMDSKLKVGAVSYLNSKPLVEDFEELVPQSRLVLDHPSRLADQMAAGNLDIGLIPVAEYLRNPGYGMVPGLGVISDGPVGSVLLLARSSLSEIKTLALDEGSRTSSALVQILLFRKLGILPRLVKLPVEASQVPEEADGVLLIGDRAMGRSPIGFHLEWDLGEVWRAETGLPFVYAVWAIRPEVEVTPVQMAGFGAVYRRGISSLDAIALRESSGHGLSPTAIRSYLTNNIRFELGRREAKGMDLFGHMLVDFDAGFAASRAATRKEPVQW